MRYLLSSILLLVACDSKTPGPLKQVTTDQVIESKACFPVGKTDRNPNLISEVENSELEIVNEKVIYGKDNRRDFFCLTDEQKKLTSSVVALVRKERLVDIDNDIVKLHTVKFSNKRFEKAPHPLCKAERFSEQQTAPFCTGVLTKNDEVLTAGHCIKNAEDLSNIRFVFGFNIAEPESLGPKTFNANQVYESDRLIGRQLVGKDFPSRSIAGTDWAIVKLKNKVPTEVATKVTVDPTNTFKGMSLVAIGHPAGLPLKYTDDAKIRNHSVESPLFYSNLDTYGGSSGSPIFNQVNGNLVGILSKGVEDFVSCKKTDCFKLGKCECNSDCRLSNVCSSAGCDGEAVMKVNKIPKLKQ